MKLQSQRHFFHTHLLSNAYFCQQMLYVFAYPVGDYLHLSLLIQVYFQIHNSSALGSKRICKKIRKEKLFCFQLINLHLRTKKEQSYSKRCFIIASNKQCYYAYQHRGKKSYIVYLVQKTITRNHLAWSCTQEFYIHISSFNWGLITLAFVHTFCLSFLFQILSLGLR